MKEKKYRRVNINIGIEQYEQLRAHAYKLRVSIAEILRRCIDGFFGTKK